MYQAFFVLLPAAIYIGQQIYLSSGRYKITIFSRLQKLICFCAQHMMECAVEYKKWQLRQAFFVVILSASIFSRPRKSIGTSTLPPAHAEVHLKMQKMMITASLLWRCYIGCLDLFPATGIDCDLGAPVNYKPKCVTKCCLFHFHIYLLVKYALLCLRMFDNWVFCFFLVLYCKNTVRPTALKKKYLLIFCYIVSSFSI